jgi:hypothetical protein
MTRALVVLCLVFSAACEWPQQTTVNPDLLGSISYGWDARTKLCFAFVSSVNYGGHTSISLSYVPLAQSDCR